MTEAENIMLTTLSDLVNMRRDQSSWWDVANHALRKVEQLKLENPVQSNSIDLDSDIAEQRQHSPIYKAIARAETFLHTLMEDEKYKDEAGDIHGELHEAAYLYVTRKAERGATLTQEQYDLIEGIINNPRTLSDVRETIQMLLDFTTIDTDPREYRKPGIYFGKKYLGTGYNLNGGIVTDDSCQWPQGAMLVGVKMQNGYSRFMTQEEYDKFTLGKAKTE